MRPVSRLAAGLTAALLVGSLTGCGGSPDAVSSGTDKDASAQSAGTDGAEGRLEGAADLSTCRADASPAATPYGKDFPRDWPFPSDAVVFHAEDRDGEGTIVTAVSSQPFEKVLEFMNTDVVSAGFDRDTGETEEHDAEAEWEGQGYRGRWAIQESGSCPGDTVIQVLAGRE
jgi:hypothetical protein